MNASCHFPRRSNKVDLQVGQTGKNLIPTRRRVPQRANTGTMFDLIRSQWKHLIGRKFQDDGCQLPVLTSAVKRITSPSFNSRVKPF